MKNIKKISVLIILLAIVIIGVWYFNRSEEPEETHLTLVNEVQYLCKDGKSIEAGYFKGEPVSTELDEMPTPSGEARILLSDKRELKLPQTISASGIRYANEDDSIVFWSKGNGAFLLEDDLETYSGCIAISEDSGGLANIYLDDENGYLIRYPSDYETDTDHEIKGVKFIPSETFFDGTNLSKESTGLYIEIIPNREDCNAKLFLEEGMTEEKMVGDYSFGSRIEGAVGHRYEEQVWAIGTGKSCLAIRYMIHYTIIENYPEGSIKEFDKQELIREFDKIRESLVIA